MAHRKPLGSTFTGLMDWPRDSRPRPELGYYLRSAAGTWYRVVGLHETSNPDKVLLTRERIASPTGVEGRSPYPEMFIDGDGIHRVLEFVWYPRKKRRAA